MVLVQTVFAAEEKDTSIDHGDDQIVTSPFSRQRSAHAQAQLCPFLAE